LLPAVVDLQVLCFYGLNRSLLSTTENLYLLAGKPEVRTQINLLQLVLMAVLMYPLTISYGIVGAAVAAMPPSLLDVVLTLHEAGKIIGENFTYIGRNFVPAIIGSLIMALALWGWQEIAVGLSPLIRLAVSVMVGGAIYVGYLWWRNREIFYEVKGLEGRR
jgi:PST family polysaccharide transporter/lipopolysaccharide exporter